jgi:phosphoribosyl 1,2-cyclic phosphodiesterase
VRFASLGSGSKGNSTIIQSDNTCIMIDCGFSVKDCVRRLERLNKTPNDIDAILVTHEHSDHWKGVLPLATRYSIDIYITSGCLRATGLDANSYLGINLMDSHQVFKIGDIEVKPIPVPHDANEPVQFILQDINSRFGILTDVGSITPYIIEQYSGCNGLLLEANHDLGLLQSGSYPRFLKDRVGGQWGHLNNQQTADLLNVIDHSSIQQLVIGHISLSNNSKQLAKTSIENVYKGAANIIYADQEEGFDWLHLSAL